VVFEFFQRRSVQLREWWRAPITKKDRRTGALVGGSACFWIAALGRIAFDTASFTELGLWAIGGAVFGIALGRACPKPVTLLMFPFAVFGISSSGT
jgi:hypothetical protein